MHFHYAHNFQLAHIISPRWYSVWQRSRESKHELPIVMKVLFCTQETNFFSCIIYCQELYVLRLSAIIDLQGTIGKAIQYVVIKSNFIFIEIII